MAWPVISSLQQPLYRVIPDRTLNVENRARIMTLPSVSSTDCRSLRRYSRLRRFGFLCESAHGLISDRVLCGLTTVAQFISICRWLQLIHKGWLTPLENAPFS